MRLPAAGALWGKLASVPLGWYLAVAVPVVGLIVVRKLRHFRRRRGSIRPIGYFSYITHSAAPAVCARCGVEVTDKTKRYCLANPRKFRGMIYCDRHQRPWQGMRSESAGRLSAR